jgi:cytochrome bd-type quinol oxidase subunit 2
MIKKIKNMFIALTAVATLVVPVFVPAAAYAASSTTPNDTQAGLCQGINLDPTASNCDSSSVDAQTKVNDLLKQVINIFSVIVGVIAVFMIIFGGLKYITSGGDSGNVSGAKNTIIYALVGLVIVALAQFIVRFVLGKATGAI